MHLIHHALVMQYLPYMHVFIDSGNALLLDGAKWWPESLLTNWQLHHQQLISMKIWQNSNISILEMNLRFPSAHCFCPGLSVLRCGRKKINSDQLLKETNSGDHFWRSPLTEELTFHFISWERSVSRWLFETMFTFQGWQYELSQWKSPKPSFYEDELGVLYVCICIYIDIYVQCFIRECSFFFS